MNSNQPLYTYTLRLADNALVLGHRLSEWCSKAPFIEEDLALTNIALDMIGRAQALLKYAAEIEGSGHSEDDLAYRRPENHYYNFLIAEQANGDFATSITRQLYISVYEYLVYSQLEKSRDTTLAAIASKAIKEIRYHYRHAAEWAVRLGDGTAESHARMQKAVNDLWMYTGEMFEMDELDAGLMREGIAVDVTPLRSQWHELIKGILNEATLNVPDDGYMQTGSKQGVHSEHLGHILAEMQYLQRADRKSVV